MPGGRPPTPTQLKVLRGTARPDRVNAREPQPPTSGTRAPVWLEGRALRAWQWIAPLLRDMRVLTAADRHALALLCDAYAEYLDCRDAIAEHGRTYTTITQTGGTMVRPRPEVMMQSDAWRRVQRMMVEFGLTPSSRSKVEAAGAEERDPFEEFLRGRPSSAPSDA